MRIERVYLDGIEVSERMRPLQLDRVAVIKASIAEIGLRTPLTVMAKPDGEDTRMILVTGNHRLEALRQLGEDATECFVIDDNEIEAQLWEIAENLHRAELTALERDEQIAKWVKLNAEKVSQVATPGGRQPEFKGVRAAERELGIKRDDASRAVKVASLSDEAKDAAREVGLDNNRSALLDAAKHNTVAEQVSAIHRRVAPKTIDIPDQKDWETVEAEQKRKLMQAWNAASPNVQAWFRETVVDAPLMDRRYG